MNASRFTGLVGRNVTLALLALGLAMMLLPVALDLDMMNGGAASLFIGLFLFVCCLILLPFFQKRAVIMRQIHRQEGVLAWWRYPAAAWEKEKKKQIGELGAMRLGGFALAALFALIGLIVFFMDVEEMGAFLLIMLGIGAFFILFTQLAAIVSAKRLETTEDEAVIHTDGLFYRGSLTSWGGMNRLEAVGWDPGNPSMLVFCYRQFQRHGMKRTFARIPIPEGCEQQAVSLVETYRLPLDETWQKRCAEEKDLE